jgi:RNA polymerase sigma-70 factor (ECF subfamily)
LDDAEHFASVLAGAAAGESWAAEVLFAQLHGRLLRFFRAREQRAAEDLTAEVWEAVASGIGSFDGQWPAFRAWVFLIARRRLIEHSRRASRRRTEPHADVVFADLVAEEEPERDVLELMSGEHAAVMIGELLGADQAEVVLLRVLGELDVAQVAEIMGRSENWVRVNQHRALRLLADRLDVRSGVIP